MLAPEGTLTPQGSEAGAWPVLCVLRDMVATSTACIRQTQLLPRYTSQITSIYGTGKIDNQLLWL